jgi:hypothetical protein
MEPSARRWRQLLVALHVITSVGWMGQALAIFALVAIGLASDDPDTRLSAYSMAQVVDGYVLVYLANAAAFSGLMLCALTPWGYFRHWWVLTKFAITIAQLYLGIFLLGPHLDAAVREAGRGGPDPAQWPAAGAAFMASAIAFQAWISLTKPWPRTPWPATPRRLPTAPRWLFAAAVAVPIADYLLGRLVLGFPMPGLQLLTVVGYPFWRSAQLRKARAAERTADPQRRRVAV